MYTTRKNVKDNVSNYQSCKRSKNKSEHNET